MNRPPLISSLRSLASTAVDIVDARLSLAFLELREAQSVLLKSLVFVGLAIVCLALMLIFLAGLVVVVFWETHRVAAVASLVGVFGLLSAALAWLTYAQLRGVSALFGATRLELAKDREALTGFN